ncbi:transcription termination/antitermination protein NusG [Turicibacter sanguinis]|nr:transcription termination/antitermination protein NusG [Turicibacter sanguinis]MDB8541669.1 transcription termination/antitermination protein NusG [Turicibacter sanguinis]
MIVEKRWYVVQTYAGYENKVMTNLLKRIETMNMQEKIFRVLIPEEKEVKIKDGVRKEKMRKTFPGYVLVEMIDTDDSWYMVRNTPGVTGFLGSSGKGTRPVPLPMEEVMPILKKMGITSVEVSLDIQVGQRVLVAAGPFSGQVGTIESIDQEHSKVSVLVDLFGRETPVELDFNQICEVE